MGHKVEQGISRRKGKGRLPVPWAWPGLETLWHECGSCIWGSGKATCRARRDMGQTSTGHARPFGPALCTPPGPLRVKPELGLWALRTRPSQHRPTETLSATWQACAQGGRVTGGVDAEGHHSPCLMTVTRTLEVLLPAEERMAQRYSALSSMASCSQLSTWVLPSSSVWLCVGTHVSSSRPFFSQMK